MHFLRSLFLGGTSGIHGHSIYIAFWGCFGFINNEARLLLTM
jgi:hypothetical protein